MLFYTGSGRAGGGGPHLPPQSGRPTYHQIGPFNAILAPTLAQKTAPEIPTNLQVALLVKAPNPDGDFYEELSAEGYERQPITRVAHDSQFDANAEAVAFNVSGGAEVGHVGLFDLEGKLRFYGRLVGQMTRTAVPCDFVFHSRSLKLKRIQLTRTDGPRPQLGGGPLWKRS
ncbi:phage tail fiber protein [Phenylobacterium sp.]|jgi:hypothetical protein|uniref:phage tail fiber protein n=1 Tax=Phenylobacterium sp. TaxID=1871053 RepID=UPI002F3F299B